MKYMKITATKYYSKERNVIITIIDKYNLNSINLTLNLNYPLEIINGLSDEIIIPIHDNGLINTAYIKRKIFKEETGKEEIIKEYLEIPNVFLFKGVNYIKIIV